MKFALDDQRDGLTIDSYAADHLRVGGRRFECSLALGPELLIDRGIPSALDELRPEHFQSLLRSRPQVVLLGTGNRQIFPPAALYAEVLRSGIGVEVMSTASACRTYNIIRGEGRRVAALLLLDAVSE